jgi:hypothetical protein
MTMPNLVEDGHAEVAETEFADLNALEKRGGLL